MTYSFWKIIVHRPRWRQDSSTSLHMPKKNFPDSLYRPGKRTPDWLKIKARLQQEFVVGGFTAPKGSRKHLGAVALGAYTSGELRHYGYARSGFSEKGLKDAVEKMKPLFTEKCPFVN